MGLYPYLLLAAVVFAIGLFGVVTRRNTISILLGVELMLNAANLAFVTASLMVAWQLFRFRWDDLFWPVVFVGMVGGAYRSRFVPISLLPRGATLARCARSAPCRRALFE